MRPRSSSLAAALALGLASAGAAAAQEAAPPAGGGADASPAPSRPGYEPRSSNPIVEEALRGAEQAQEADKGVVDRMSEEAARATEGAPSGAEAVGSTAPPANSAARSPSGESGAAGLSLRAMIDRPIADRDGEPAGTVRDVLLGSEGGGTLVLVEEVEGGPVRAVNVARVLPAPDGKGGYYVDLDRESITALPGFRREGEAGWRMTE
jgi:hypothetical protein